MAPRVDETPVPPTSVSSNGSSPPTAQVTSQPALPYGTFPANYKDLINTWVAANEPQDAGHIEWQTQPAPSDLPVGQGRHLYGYLVIFNSRSGIGGRPKTHSALIRDGKIVSVSGFGP